MENIPIKISNNWKLLKLYLYNLLFWWEMLAKPFWYENAVLFLIITANPEHPN